MAGSAAARGAKPAKSCIARRWVNSPSPPAQRVARVSGVAGDVANLRRIASTTPSKFSTRSLFQRITITALGFKIRAAPIAFFLQLTAVQFDDQPLSTHRKSTTNVPMVA